MMVAAVSGSSYYVCCCQASCNSSLSGSARGARSPPDLESTRVFPSGAKGEAEYFDNRASMHISWSTLGVDVAAALKCGHKTFVSNRCNYTLRGHITLQGESSSTSSTYRAV